MKATKRLYLTADRKKVVEEGNGKARFSLCAPGQEIPKKVIDQYNLEKLFKQEKKVEKVTNKNVDAPENKSGLKINRLKKKDK